VLLFRCLKRVIIVVKLQSAIDNPYILEPVEIFIHQTCTTGPNVGNQFRISARIFLENTLVPCFSTQATSVSIGVYRARLGPEDHLPCDTKNKDAEQNVCKISNNYPRRINYLVFLQTKSEKRIKYALQSPKKWATRSKHAQRPCRLAENSGLHCIVSTHALDLPFYKIYSLMHLLLDQGFHSPVSLLLPLLFFSCFCLERAAATDSSGFFLSLSAFSRIQN